MDIDVEGLLGEHLVPALFAALAVFAWLLLVAHRLEKAKGLAELCRKAGKIRGEQEGLRAAGKPAPHLEGSRRVEAGLRALLVRYGLEAGAAPKPAARR